jgi:hypothetical protein
MWLKCSINSVCIIQSKGVVLVLSVTGTIEPPMGNDKERERCQWVAIQKAQEDEKMIKESPARL